MKSCPCHPSDALDTAGRSFWIRQRAFLSDIQSSGRSLGLPAGSTCPMKGRRSPELAAGELHVLMNRWLATEAIEIMAICAHLLPAQRDIIIHDWEAAKQHLVYSMSAKFSYAKIIPFLLCGMAHHDQAPHGVGCRLCWGEARLSCNFRSN
jgi:hypothetical protein